MSEHTYEKVITDLRSSYSHQKAEQRNGTEKAPWKVAERQQFLDLLQREGKISLLEVGAGTGNDSLFFQENGLQVVCTDLSPDMVAFCRGKGLNAHVMDFLNLDFPPASFDAIYALNCLLHVPSDNLPAVLQKLQSLLKPGGLFFLGVYGGHEHEGFSEQDWHNPPRFFSYHTDEFWQEMAARFFEIVSFKTLSFEEKERRFQAMILRRSIPGEVSAQAI